MASWWFLWSFQGFLFLMFKPSYFKVLRRIVNILALKDPEFPESNMFWKCAWVIGCQILTHLAPKMWFEKGKPGRKKEKKKISPKPMSVHFSWFFRDRLKCYFHHITFHHIFASSWSVRARMLIPAMPLT